MNKLSRGAKIVVEQWLLLKPKERLLIVTSNLHQMEAEEIKIFARKKHAEVEFMIFPDHSGQVGHYFDEHEDAFDAYDVILGATTHSLVTTRAVKRAIERGSRFLSLPLSTNDNRSLLEYDFFLMDTLESQKMGDYLMKHLNQATTVHITTEAGTDLMFYKNGRDAKGFNGSTILCNGYASSSFEVYIAVEEYKTEGVAYVDASLGYLGVPKESVRLELVEGRIVSVEENSTGKKLKEYMEHFEDDRMYVAGELGFGLNTYSVCSGNSYIEDESAYGTFHIGFGRNLALGGVHEAKAHFDLVFHKPDVFADDVLIMKAGEIVYHEEEINEQEDNDVELAFGS